MSTMAVGPMNLASAIAPLPPVVVHISDVSVLLLPIQVGASTSATAITVPSVGVFLICYAAVVYKVDVIRSHLFT